MKTITYTNEEAPRKKYLQFVQQLYGKEPAFHSFFRDLEAQFDPQCPTAKLQERTFLLIEDDSECRGHIALMVDSREQEGIGWFGFFECVSDKKAFDLLWYEFLKLCQNKSIHTLRGPINGSIWYQYRFTSGGEDAVPTFQGEMLCEKYYHKLFQPLASEELHYYSAMREHFDKLIAVTEPFYQKAEKQNIEFTKKKTINADLTKGIFDLARTIFSSSWGYVPLNDEELRYFYSTDKQGALDSVYTMYNRKELIGFATCFRENEGILNLKTLAIHPDFQGKGLGNAFIHFIHKDVQGRCNRMIYALIRSENRVSKLPNDDAEIIRQYSAYEIAIR